MGKGRHIRMRADMKPGRGAILAAMIILAALAACSRTEPRVKIGEPLPPVTVSDLKNNPVAFPAGYAGSLVVVIFWETGCPFCEKEMPLAENLYQKYRDRGFSLIALNVGDSRQEVEEAVSRMGITYPVLLDPERESKKKYGIVGFPTIFFVEKNGVVKEKILGGVKTSTLDDMVAERL